MKQIKIKTSKGEFLVVDYNNKELFSKFLLNVFKKYNIQNNHKRYKLSKISEEEASEIICIEDIINNPQTGDSINHVKSLHSLLKSKDIYLFENPFSNKIGIINFDYHRNKAEQKTFYNPYIFKL